MTPALPRGCALLAALLKAHFSLWPFLALCTEVLPALSPGAAPAARSEPRSSSRSRSSSCLVWLEFLAFLSPPFPAGLAGCPQALPWEVAKEFKP